MQYVTLAYLPSEFKFGFELEAYATLSKIDKAQKNICDYWNVSDESMDVDSSINPSKRSGIGFEFKSPVINVTPDNLKKLIKFLTLLQEWKVETNKSCGFHIHFSFPNFSAEDAAWILVNIAGNNKYLETLYAFKNINFISKEYANNKTIGKIRHFIKQNILSEIIALLTDEKYSIVRLHPQGTIEWRGPRNFLNDIDVIKDFVISLWSFVKMLNNCLSSTSVENITKKDFIKAFKNTNSNVYKVYQKLPKGFSESQDLSILNDVFKNNRWLRNCKYSDLYVLEHSNGYVFSGNWLDGRFEGNVARGLTVYGGTFAGQTFLNSKFVYSNDNTPIWETGKCKQSYVKVLSSKEDQALHIGIETDPSTIIQKIQNTPELNDITTDFKLNLIVDTNEKYLISETKLFSKQFLAKLNNPTIKLAKTKIDTLNKIITNTNILKVLKLASIYLIDSSRVDEFRNMVPLTVVGLTNIATLEDRKRLEKTVSILLQLLDEFNDFTFDIDFAKDELKNQGLFEKALTISELNKIDYFYPDPITMKDINLVKESLEKYLGKLRFILRDIQDYFN